MYANMPYSAFSQDESDLLSTYFTTEKSIKRLWNENGYCMAQFSGLQEIGIDENRVDAQARCRREFMFV
jgi:hypothetical protein